MNAALSPPGDKSSVYVGRGGSIFTPETPACPPSLSSLTYRLQIYKSGRFLTLKIKPTRAEMSLVSQLSSVSTGRELQLFFSFHPFVSEKGKADRVFSLHMHKKQQTVDDESAIKCCGFCCQTCVWHTHTHSKRITVPQSPLSWQKRS